MLKYCQMMVFAPYTLSFDAISHILLVGTITCYVSLEGITDREEKEKKETYIYYDCKLTYFNRYCEIRTLIFDRYMYITIGHVTAFLEIIL